MLFLYRPRQTWMPFPSPRNLRQQQAYNLELQQRFEASRRVSPPVPDAAPIAALKDLAELHASGALTDAEFGAAKAKVLGTGEGAA
jgi:putative oligomerization/nucleic acid binding protein